MGHKGVKIKGEFQNSKVKGTGLKCTAVNLTKAAILSSPLIISLCKSCVFYKGEG